MAVPGVVCDPSLVKLHVVVHWGEKEESGGWVSEQRPMGRWMPAVG